jgi:hypothetical protein
MWRDSNEELASVNYFYSFGGIFILYLVSNCHSLHLNALQGPFQPIFTRGNTMSLLISEIKEVLAAIENDLEPFARGDSMRYTGYLAENAADLQFLIAALLNKGE